MQRRRGRDVATGVVLGAALGAAALFLYLGTQTSSTTGASFTILFGSMFVISPDTVPALIASGLLALAAAALLSRMLLLTALSPEIAAVGGAARTAADRLPCGACRGGGAVRGGHRRGAVHRAADRAGRDVAAAHQAPGAGDAGRGADRCRRHLAGHPARLRQLLLAAQLLGAGWVSFFVVALVVLGYLLTYARLPRRSRTGRGQAAPAPENQEAPQCSPA